MLAYGGQTALNCGVKLDDSGLLKKYGIKVLGTPISGIKQTEDRQLFKDSMQKCGISTLLGKTIQTFDEAKQVAQDIGYPVIIRVAYTLGGKGGGVAQNELDLYEIVTRGLNASMVGQVLVEKYVGRWKQIEYEVIRDHSENQVIVCNMENVLSMRVHTGDNIVVAPSQTLNNSEYHMLRTASLHATKYVGIVGECNIQFALNPESSEYAAIEINPRLSRSSALASKATGYPLAYMSAKIGLGYDLSELTNRITKITTACFEPSLDYIVCKHPRWDFEKFELANKTLGPTMKSIGEVMGIGRTFEESLQKAIRMLDNNHNGLVGDPSHKSLTEEELENKLLQPDDSILYHVAHALYTGMSKEKIRQLTMIDPWFIHKINNIVNMMKKLDTTTNYSSLLRESKQLGFSDKQLANIVKTDEGEIRKQRKQLGITPVVKQIDTLAAEWPVKTNYLYFTYGGTTNDIEVDDSKSIIVLGAGPYRIGSSVEFDWGTVNMVWGIQKNSDYTISIINCNPETVSTDYDICDRLYFEELTYERILDICDFERPSGIITCVGGQTANNLIPQLDANPNSPVLGTLPANIDRAENRSKFSSVLDKLHIKQPIWEKFSNLENAREFAQNVGYPVIVRPSYVLSGAAMKVVWSKEEMRSFVRGATNLSSDHPVVISKFMLNSLEADVDGVCDGSNVVIGAIIEHIESAGIHSGDAIMCIPPRRLSTHIIEKITDYAKQIALEFKIIGPFNLQFLIHDGHVYVIELNIRASRSMPFVSKFVGVNLIDLASRAILGNKLPAIDDNSWQKITQYGVKTPQFSFMQLDGADIVLGVEMQSTGESACFGDSFYDALSKSLTSVGNTLPSSGSALITIGGMDNKEKLYPTIILLHKLGFKIFATEHTAEFLSQKIDDITIVHKISEPDRSPNISDYLYKRKIDFIINIPSTSTLEKYVGMLYDEYQIRRKALELGIPVLTTVELAESFVKTLEWLRSNKPTLKPLDSYKDV